MKFWKSTVFVLAFCVCFSTAQGRELETLFTQVKELGLKCQTYSLGAVLNDVQKETARVNRLKAPYPHTYKFVDQGVYVVVYQPTNQVLLIYQIFENLDHMKLTELVGELTFTYEYPSLMAHDRIIYWAYGLDGLLSTEAFDMAKETAKGLDVIATVKFTSEQPITGQAPPQQDVSQQGDPKQRESKQEKSKGDGYLLLSSPPILQILAEIK